MTGSALCGLSEGDFVITEFLTDPVEVVDLDTQTSSNGLEWFEFLNATQNSQSVAGMAVWVSGAGDPREHRLDTDATLEPGEYFVVGGRGSEESGFVDVSTSAQFANTGGVIALDCRGTIVDQVAYGERGPLERPAKGSSIGFDGAQTPSGVLNDDAALWCAPAESYDGVNLGTPGSANFPCGSTACSEGGETRDTVLASGGELVITEVFANPDGADDPNKEWLEVYNASSRVLDLNSLRIIHTLGSGSVREATVTESECVSVAAGEFAVIGRSSDPTLNGSLDIDARARDLELFNGESVLDLFVGSVLIDSASLPSSSSGQSSFVSSLVSAGNDDSTAFCLASTVGLFDGQGTPGRVDTSCVGSDQGGEAGGTDGEGTGSEGLRSCMDNGVSRDSRMPNVGEVAISEVFADAAGADDGREFVELYISSLDAVDLNDLEISSTNQGLRSNSTTLRFNSCLSFAEGAYVVLGTSAAAADGRVDVDLDEKGSFFYNSPQTVTVSLNGIVLDEATIPEPSADVALRMIADVPAADANDSAAAWCEAEASPGSSGVCR